MNKRIAISVITVLAVGVSAAGYFVLQQSNKLRETESEIVALEQNVSALEENVSTLEESGSILEVRLTGLEAKVSTLEADLDKANDDVELRQKLVGFGGCAEWSYPDEPDLVNHLEMGFFVENPDCVSEIAIDRVCIFASDGTVIYEGPLGVEADDEWEEYTGPLKPHEKLLTGLEYYELPPPKSEAEILCAYTVEIFWSGAKDGLPLTGWATTLNVVRKATEPYDVVDIMVWRTTQMVNMEQVLDSED